MLGIFGNELRALQMIERIMVAAGIDGVLESDHKVQGRNVGVHFILGRYRLEIALEYPLLLQAPTIRVRAVFGENPELIGPYIEYLWDTRKRPLWIVSCTDMALEKSGAVSEDTARVIKGLGLMPLPIEIKRWLEARSRSTDDARTMNTQEMLSSVALLATSLRCCAPPPMIQIESH